MFRVEALRVQLVERCSTHARTIPHIPIPTRALTGMDFLVGSLTPSSQRIVTRECFDEIVDSKCLRNARPKRIDPDLWGAWGLESFESSREGHN